MKIRTDLLALIAGLLVTTSSVFSSLAQCSEAGGNCLVYLPGAGSAGDLDIDKRVASFQNVFQKYNGHLADVKVFRASGGYTPATGQGLRWYDEQNETEVLQFFESHQGRNVHVVMSSAGAVFFREKILPRLSNKQFGIVVEVEPMFPGRKPPTTAPTGYDPLIHVTMETEYTGDLAPAFKDMFGAAGSLMPNCSPPVCYKIKHNTVAIDSIEAFLRAMGEHAKGVTWGEDRASSIESIGLRKDEDGGLAILSQKLQELLIETPPQGPPLSPQGSNGTPPISGGGGNGAANGGGVGIESFPAWLDFKTHREHLQELQRKEAKP